MLGRKTRWGVALAALVGATLAGPPPAHAAFPGSNGLIVFDTTFAGSRYADREVATIDPNNPSPETTRTQITSNNLFDGVPVWSPDGTQILFARGGRHFKVGYDLFVVSADGSNTQRVTNDAAGFNYNESWAPASADIGGHKWVIFSSNRLGHYQTYITDVATPTPGSEILMGRTDTGFKDQFPEWSPDGTWIAFTSNRSGNEELWIQRVDYSVTPPGLKQGGRNLVQITSDPGNDRYPSWSPDSAQIVWQSDRTGNFDLFTTQMVAPYTPIQLTSNPGADHHPCWSPDGLWIAYESARSRDDPDEIFIVPAAGGQPPTRITTHDGTDAHLDWQALNL
jgi:Tol biopolymer transport system component